MRVHNYIYTVPIIKELKYSTVPYSTRTVLEEFFNGRYCKWIFASKRISLLLQYVHNHNSLFYVL